MGRGTKISGLTVRGEAWTRVANRPIILDALRIFGIDRCMFASNSSVDDLKGSWDYLYRQFKRAVADSLSTDRRKLFAASAARFLTARAEPADALWQRCIPQGYDPSNRTTRKCEPLSDDYGARRRDFRKDPGRGLSAPVALPIPAIRPLPRMAKKNWNGGRTCTSRAIELAGAPELGTTGSKAVSATCSIARSQRAEPKNQSSGIEPRACDHPAS